VCDVTSRYARDHFRRSAVVLRMGMIHFDRHKSRWVMTMRILLALDVTPACTKIVQEAVARPWPPGSTFFLLHVLDPFRFIKAPISFQKTREAADAQLRDLNECLSSAGWKTEMDVLLGHLRSGITDTAASWKADLVMLGANDLNIVTRLFLGSTAQSVLRQSSCSIEIVKPWPNRETGLQRNGMKILLATDGSEYSTAALRSVAARPWPKGSEARVISVPDPFVPTTVFPYFEWKEIEELNTSALKRAKKLVDAGVGILSGLDAKVSSETPLPKDSPARVIVREAQEWGAHLIVLGSHGRRGFDRLTMGSVSEHVTFHAPCSVEVIRSRKAQNTRHKEKEKRNETERCDDGDTLQPARYESGFRDTTDVGWKL